MTRRNDYRNRIELLQGTLDMLILQTLRWGPQHGYGIVQTLFINSSEALQVETGSLYPALHRLERQKWVRSEWKRTESNQRAKYYSITAAGKTQLASDRNSWQQMVEVIAAIMGPQPKEGAS
jgi:PadR family transcriptional regulator, regulatory protein PadR